MMKSSKNVQFGLVTAASEPLKKLPTVWVFKRSFYTVGDSSILPKAKRQNFQKPMMRIVPLDSA